MMPVTEKSFLKLLDELQITNERLDCIANALEGVFAVLAGNDELGLDGVLPVLQRLEEKMGAK